MKAPRNRAVSLALSLLFVTGAASMSVAKTFVYVSNAQDSNIDGYVLDTTNGMLTPIGKTEAAKLVMPMTGVPNKKYLVCRLLLEKKKKKQEHNRTVGQTY